MEKHDAIALLAAIALEELTVRRVQLLLDWRAAAVEAERQRCLDIAESVRERAALKGEEFADAGDHYSAALERHRSYGAEAVYDVIRAR